MKVLVVLVLKTCFQAPNCLLIRTRCCISPGTLINGEAEADKGNLHAFKSQHQLREAFQKIRNAFVESLGTDRSQIPSRKV